MAFFSQVNSLFNNQNQPRKSDALLAPVPGNDPNQPQQQGGGIELSKASTAVQGGGDGGNKAEQGQAASQYTQVNPQGKGFAAKAIVDSNSNGNLQAADAKSYGGNAIADSQTALQAEANKYSTANTYKPQTTQDDLSNAVNQGGDAFHKVHSLLTSAPKPVTDFAYNNQSDGKTEDYVKGLNTTTGLQNALKQQNSGTSDYNDTGATIDALLLGQNADFKNQQADLVKQYGAYDQAKADAVQQAKGVQSKYANDAQAEKDSATKYLSGSSDSMKAALQSKLDKARSGRDAELSTEQEGLHGKANSILDEYKNKLSSGAGQYAGDSKFADVLDLNKGYFSDGTHYVDKANVPGSDSFIHGGSNNLDLSSVTTADDAAQFQRINELLGRGDRLTSTEANNTGGAFDEAGYRAALDAQFNPRLQQLKALSDKKASEINQANIAKALAAAKPTGGLSNPDNVKAISTAANNGNQGVAGSNNGVPSAPAKGESGLEQLVQKGFSKIKKLF